MYESHTSASGETATTLILIGLILQVIEVLVLLVVGLVVPIIGGIFLGLGAIGVIWVLLVYFLSYQPAREGAYDSAQTPTLVFAILSLLTGALISGILYIIAWVKLRDAA